MNVTVGVAGLLLCVSVLALLLSASPANTSLGLGPSVAAERRWVHKQKRAHTRNRVHKSKGRQWYDYTHTRTSRPRPPRGAWSLSITARYETDYDYAALGLNQGELLQYDAAHPSVLDQLLNQTEDPDFTERTPAPIDLD